MDFYLCLFKLFNDLVWKLVGLFGLVPIVPFTLISFFYEPFGFTKESFFLSYLFFLGCIDPSLYSKVGISSGY